ncbi:unnamed protein product [Heterobilharzia americana]|nr:unnamed protein product [Heterobilharzia americana]
MTVQLENYEVSLENVSHASTFCQFKEYFPLMRFVSAYSFFHQRECRLNCETSKHGSQSIDFSQLTLRTDYQSQHIPSRSKIKSVNIAMIELIGNSFQAEAVTRIIQAQSFENLDKKGSTLSDL